AEWVDKELVVDGQLVSSRKPDDLPAFCAQLVKHVRAGNGAGATAPDPTASSMSAGSRAEPVPGSGAMH
ncbi:MAG: DJ-1/PfpI family protein, partial [Solirubrobacteraceae bacterium]